MLVLQAQEHFLVRNCYFSFPLFFFFFNLEDCFDYFFTLPSNSNYLKEPAVLNWGTGFSVS